MAKKIPSPEGRIQVVELTGLKVHTIVDDPINGYQRALKNHWKFIFDNFNPVAAGILTIAERAIDRFILDG